MPKKIIIKIIIIVLALVFVLSGYFFVASIKNLSKQSVRSLINNENNRNGKIFMSTKDQLAAQTKIKKFKNYKELKDFLQNGPINSRSYGFFNGLAGSEKISRETMIDPGMPTMAKLDSGQSDLSGSNDYSTTNIQVKGVDEPDIIKTDGKYIYAVSGNNLFIVDAYPAGKADILSKIEFKARPQDIFVNGGNLVVFGRNNNIRDAAIYKTLKRRGNYVFFKVFNIKDKKNPKQIRDLDFEGNYSNARMIGDYVYFITSDYSYYYNNEIPLPAIIKDEKIVLNKCAGEKCAMPPVYYFDIPYDSYHFTTVTAINVKNNNENINSETYMLSGRQNMYVSQNNIYITYTKYISEWQLRMEVMKKIIYPMLPAKDRERVDKIEAVENFILSPAEKTRKIGMMLAGFTAALSEEKEKKLKEEIDAAMRKKYKDISKELEKTVIHKISIDKGVLKYKTFGEVPGYVLNQFSMDEHNGYFRIATTKSRRWSQFAENSQQQSYSNLYVLDKNLKIIGALEGMAPGEKIYSVRFMQDRAYMAAFKQTDPLFVIDLKDPKNPKALGKLKIPGFSNYLHPYDKNILIGIGKETKENKRGGVITGGIKLSLFDVSDVANPKEIDKYILGGRGSDSIALRDHKAFLFSRAKNLLVIPVTIRKSVDGASYPKLIFNGAAVFKVDKTGFKLRGKINHSNGGKKGESEKWDGYGYYNNTVKRSLYIGDILYTFSSKYLKMNKLNDLELVKNLKLEKGDTASDNDFKIIN